MQYLFVWLDFTANLLGSIFYPDSQLLFSSTGIEAVLGRYAVVESPRESSNVARWVIFEITKIPQHYLEALVLL